MTLTATIQQIPPDHMGGYELERAELVTSAATYDDALKEAQSRVPAGWRVLHIQVDRG